MSRNAYETVHEVIERREVREPAMPHHDLAEVLPLRTPYMIFIDPCGSCNFKCNFCPCNNTDKFAKERHTIMKFEEFKKIVDDISEFEDKIKIINVYCYGEPLLNKDYIRMLKYVKEKNISEQVRCTTNGSLLDHEMNVALVDSGVDLIRISVEGITSEAYKAICDVDFEIESLRKNVADLYSLSRGTNTSISVKAINASFKTVKDVESFFDMFSDISDNVYMEPVDHNWGGYDIVFPEDNVDTGMADQKNYFDVTKKLPLCTPPFIEMCVHSNCDVSVCRLDWDFSLVYGNTNKRKMKDLWNSKELKSIRMKLLNAGTRSIFEHCSMCGCDGRDSLTNILSVIKPRYENDIYAVSENAE